MLDNWISWVWTLQEYVLNTKLFFFISLFPSGRRKYNTLLVHEDFWNLILAKISQTKDFDALGPKNFLFIRKPWQDWMFMWITRLQYWREDFQTYSLAEQLIQVYEGTASKECLVPHNQVYRMLVLILEITVGTKINSIELSTTIYT
jgi:hypothetical protein